AFMVMRIFCFLFAVLISSQAQSQSIVSIGGAVSLAESVSYTNGMFDKSSYYATRANAHVQLTYHSDNLFWGGLLMGGQDRGIVMEDGLSHSVVLQDFVENRVQVMMGISQQQSNSLLLPYVGLNLSFITIDAPIFELFENSNAQIPTGWNPSPSVEIGCQWIAPRIDEHRIGILNRLSLRYYPLGVINHEDPISTTSTSSEVYVPLQNKTVEVSYSLGILFHAKLKQRHGS
ncbi:MAG TPA: hypothetical protein PLU10_12730, partial [Chitinophagaceae bacterium]|nr:hypothetical protein [Chitinophagaceae bacterium]